MAFSTFCTTKGCGKIQEPYLDLQDNKVYCSICDNEISNLTSFVKNQMKTFKQFKVKKTKPFVFKCLKCNKEDRPKVVKDDIVCSICLQPMDNLSPIFKHMLKEKLKNIDKDI